MAKILIVDDEPAMVALVSDLLREAQHTVWGAANPQQALELAQSRAPDLVITDIEMPGGKNAGLSLLAELKARDPLLPVMVLTGVGTKERAVAALRAGAQDFIEKPFPVEELLRRVDNALWQRRGLTALRENAALKQQLTDRFQPEHILGDSPAMQSVLRLIRRVADTDATVLILGESGTGKELVARALHYASRRANRPFLAINCAALPETLLESELFGHRKGAFTGAAFDKPGLLQVAEGGTVLLDEIGSMPLVLQGKLLRFLQEKELRRLGDTETVRVDVRVLAATNEPLEDKLRTKSFREDLYYRLSVIPIMLPPLRARGEDVALLAAHFLQEIAARSGRPAPRLTPEAAERLRRYHWPGNVRELQNALERACLLCEEGVIQPHDLPQPVAARAGAEPPPTAAATANAAAGAGQADRLLPLKEYLHLQAVAHIQRALEVTDRNREKAARLLGVSPMTLYRRLNSDRAEAGADGDEAAE